MVSLSQLRNFFVAMTVLTIPFAGYYIPTGFISVSATNILILISLTVLSVEISKKSQLNINLSLLILFLLIILVLISGMIVSFVQDGSFRRTITIFGYILLIGVISFGVRNEYELRRLIHLVFLSSILVCLIAVMSSVFSINLGGSLIYARSIFGLQIPFTRTSGIPISHGEFGMYTLSTVPLYIVYGLRSRNPLYLGGVGVIVFSVIFILQSRSTWLALFTGIVVLTLFLQPKLLSQSSVARKLTILRKVGFLLTPVVGIGLIWVVISIGQSIDLRAQQIATSIKLLYNQPFGYGWGNIQPFFERNALPHNAFLRYGVETGLISLLALIGIYVVVVRDLLRVVFLQHPEKHLMAVGLLAGLSAVFIEASNLVGFGKSGWMWVAISAAFYRINGSTGSTNILES